MFLLFYSLYKAMFVGYFQMFTFDNLITQLQQTFNGLGTFVTSIFGDNTYTKLGEDIINVSNYGFINVASFFLALITSIGIVVMAVKGVKKAFGIFFMGIRNI